MPKIRKVPQRQCVACGQARAKRELVRVVRTPSGEVRVDPTGKLSGRGAYVCPDTGCVDRAVRDGRLAGVLERPITEEVIQTLREAAARPASPRAPVVRRIPLRPGGGAAGQTKPGEVGLPKPSQAQPASSRAERGKSEWRGRREGT